MRTDLQAAHCQHIASQVELAELPAPIGERLAVGVGDVAVRHREVAERVGVDGSGVEDPPQGTGARAQHVEHLERRAL